MIDENFRCDAIAMTRAIKDKISAELNAMTPKEQDLYFAKMDAEFAKQDRAQAKLRESEKAK